MFKVGDWVMVNELGNHEYGLTKEGSWGVITEIGHSSAYVRFSYIVKSSANYNYAIELRCLTKIKKDDPFNKRVGGV